MRKFNVTYFSAGNSASYGIPYTMDVYGEDYDQASEYFKSLCIGHLWSIDEVDMDFTLTDTNLS